MSYDNPLDCAPPRSARAGYAACVRKKILIGLGAVLLLAASALAWMIGPRNIIGMLFYDQRREGSLVVGDAAPDVVLATIDGSPDVQLASLMREKPLVLVFGSFT